MGKAQTNTTALDKYDGVEVALELLSFAGGENTISEDQAVKINEARVGIVTGKQIGRAHV